ncbi:LbetaH domain-containing protein [Aliiglaciecola lipolytica]|uniref:Colanic acid biosynthesis acetyltransferase WcaF n=1 Tax=Aliiglaciecola lipolytica E3 TaxID=1127673 RepID=K6X769_9ALTE|nr:putative colanic acid biosynthesis acetyltransferase [Aliiglaciecola lipolytica]GAC16449.1 hypothetical protein GLIP_3838 [Aliiglaciecola lipolytica E3]
MLEKNTITDPVFPISFKIKRLIWMVFYLIFFKFSPNFLFSYRAALLRLWGANVSNKARIYPTAKIWWPQNLTMDDLATIGPDVTVYNQGNIKIEESAIISQGAHLCASTHDYNDPLHPLVLAPISIGKNVWVCSEAFIGPNVTLAEGTVVGARAVVSKNTDEWAVYAGNPAKRIKSREWNL